MFKKACLLVQYSAGLPLPGLKHGFWLGDQLPVDLNASLAAEQISSSSDNCLAELKLSFSHYELLEALTDRCMNSFAEEKMYVNPFQFQV